MQKCDGTASWDNNPKYTYSLILQATIGHARTLISKHVPQSVQRDFLLWALADNNPHRKNYLQITGINKTSELAAALLCDLFDPSVLEKLSFYAGALNAYFYFEVISDNLAIGLASPQNHDLGWKQRQSVLLHFNTIMQQKLMGEQTPAAALLSPLSGQISNISSFQQSLSPAEIKKIAQYYQAQQSQTLMNDLEYSTLSYLVLNIESCLHAIALLPDHFARPNLLSSLCNRYLAMNELLQLDKTLSLTNLADYGTQTILVMPTLFYLLGAINKITPNPLLMDIFEQGLLMRALECAAAVVRILNDVGTILLKATVDDRVVFRQTLSSLYQTQTAKNPHLSVIDFLSGIAESDPFFLPLTRIRKDITYHEFNICLDNLRRQSPNGGTLDVFFKDLIFFIELYHQRYADLTITLENITSHLQNSSISNMILRMVTFHEQLYTKDFAHSQGEFATKL